MALVVGAAAIGSYESGLRTTTSTERFTSTTTSTITVTTIVNHTTALSVYENVELIGECTAASYFVPDTVEVAPSTMTTTSGSVTSYSVTYTTVYHNSTIGTSTYSASTFVNGTTTLVVTATSDDLNDRPSDGWTVTICTYHP